MLVQNTTQNYKYSNCSLINYSKNKSVNFTGQVLINKQIAVSAAQSTITPRTNWLKSLFLKKNTFQTLQNIVNKELKKCKKMDNVGDKASLRQFYEKILKIGQQSPDNIDKLINIVKTGLLCKSHDAFLLDQDDKVLNTQLSLYDRLSRAYKSQNYIPSQFETKDGKKATKKDLEAKIRLIDRFNPQPTIAGKINSFCRVFFPEYCSEEELAHRQLAVITATNACNENIVNRLLNKVRTFDYKDDSEYKDIVCIAESITHENKDVTETLLKRPNVRMEFVQEFLEVSNQFDIPNLRKMVNMFSPKQLYTIIQKLDDENIKFLNKLLKQKKGDIKKNDIVNIFDSYNKYNAKSLYFIINHLQKRVDFKKEISNVALFGNSIYEDNKEYAEKWIKSAHIDLSDLTNILLNTNKSNIELADRLLSDKNFDKTIIPTLLENIETQENSSFLQRIYNTTKIDERELTQIAILLNSIDHAIIDCNNWNITNLLNDSIRLKEQYAEIMDECGYNIDSKIQELYTIHSAEKQQVIKPSRNGQQLFVKQALTNKPRINEILKTADFDKYNDGIPLKYTRKDFYNNITGKILAGISEKEKQVIMHFFDMYNSETTYEGLLNTKDPKEIMPLLTTDKAKSAASRVQKEIIKFTQENEVITKDKNLNNILNGLIKGIPSYLSIIGKIQHKTHDYTIDIHSLKVLQSAMNNPIYDKLSDESKMVLKLSAILHDIGKREGIRDPGHANKSAKISDVILNTLPLKNDVKVRILNIIKNHHWFEGYNMSKISAGDVAIMCRYPEDFEIFQILAKADVENVNQTFHLDVTGQKDQNQFNKFFGRKMYDIERALSGIYYNSNHIFDTKILNCGNKFPKVKAYIGDNISLDLNVLNLNDLTAKENLEQYGFARGTTKKDLRFLVHMFIPTRKNLEASKATLDDSLSYQAWSTSYIKANDNPTYCKYKFGFIFDVKQSDIAEASADNIGSGYRKNMDDFSYIVLSDNNNRTFLSKALKEELKKNGINLNYENSISLAKYLLKKKHITAINKDFYIGKTLIKANTLTKSIKTVQDKLFNGNDHNEVVVLNPKIQGLIAKVNSIEECPTSFLYFAKENNLPIILMKDCG